jgi:hypothetical protein
MYSIFPCVVYIFVGAPYHRGYSMMLWVPRVVGTPFYHKYSLLWALPSIMSVTLLLGKVARRIAKEQNPDLRDFYPHKLSVFRSYHLVYVDESGCDKLN